MCTSLCCLIKQQPCLWGGWWGGGGSVFFPTLLLSTRSIGAVGDEFPNGFTSENCVTNFRRRVGQKCCHSCLQIGCIGFLAKLYRKLAVSHTMFFVPARELISRSDSWKPLGFLIFELLPTFLMPFSPKNRSILWTVKSHAGISKTEKIEKSRTPFCRPRLPLYVSKIKTGL